MTKVFADLSFHTSRLNVSVFIKKQGQDVMVVPVATDDMTVVGSSLNIVEKFKAEFGACFKITNSGEIKWLLGFEIQRDHATQTIAINQCLYIENIAERFRLQNAAPKHTPMESSAQYTKDQCPSEPIKVPYQEACGSALWAAVISRPDIQFAVGLLA